MSAEVGKQTFFKVRKSPIRAFQAYSAIANPQISYVDQSANPQISIFNPQIAILNIYTKRCTTLSLNSPKTPLFKQFFLLCKNLNQSIILYARREKILYVFADLLKF